MSNPTETQRLVPETITLLKLHMVIQAAIRWNHLHLHEFIGRAGQRYGTSDPDYATHLAKTPCERIRLTTALGRRPHAALRVRLRRLLLGRDSWDPNAFDVVDADDWLADIKV